RRRHWYNASTRRGRHLPRSAGRTLDHVTPNPVVDPIRTENRGAKTALESRRLPWLDARRAPCRHGALRSMGAQNPDHDQMLDAAPPRRQQARCRLAVRAINARPLCAVPDTAAVLLRSRSPSKTQFPRGSRRVSALALRNGPLRRTLSDVEQKT